MEQTSHQAFGQGLNSEIKNNQEYCLMEWDGIGVAVNIGYVISVTLASELHNNENFNSEMKLVSLDRQFKQSNKNSWQGKQIVILKYLDDLIGLYCQKVAFTEPLMKRKLISIPIATKTKESPILDLLKISDNDYFTIDFDKFYQYLFHLENSATQSCVDTKI